MTNWPTHQPPQPGQAPLARETALAPRVPRRWPIFAAALVVVVAVVAALLIVWWRGENGGGRATWQPPPQSFLSSSMKVQPVPGWRATVTDLGLPAAGVTDHSTIAARTVPSDPEPFIGAVGDHGYFLASSPGTPNRQWWVIGLDVRDGRPLFAPVRLNATDTAPDCFLDGPTSVLCLYDDYRAPATAWVIDAQTGMLSFTGQTDLHLGSGKLAVRQVGIYLVAETQGKGVFGVGSSAEPTWFIPGDGSVRPAQFDNPDIAPPTLATQGSADPRSGNDMVFSVTNGSVIEPAMDKNDEQETTIVYPGGFAAEVDVQNEGPQVRLFDDTGKPTSRHPVTGLLSDSLDVPIVYRNNSWAALAPDGGTLIEGSGDPPSRSVLIGRTLFVRDSSGAYPVWQQYDLMTGAKGKACEFDVDNYLGSFGSVAVFKVYNPGARLVAVARDPATCDVVWKIPSQAPSFGRIWRINTTLVQLSDDGTELMSLVAPS